jgi:hypothetical protein
VFVDVGLSFSAIMIKSVFVEKSLELVQKVCFSFKGDSMKSLAEHSGERLNRLPSLYGCVLR